MNLGNELVNKHGYNPAAMARMPDPTEDTTRPILEFTEWLNRDPQAREVLIGMGIDWPVVTDGP